VLVGIYVSSTLTAWLFIANRIPQLAPFATVRNYMAGAIVIALLAIPVVRYRGQPARLFFSGATAWTILTLTYMAMEMHFSLLDSRMGPFNLFILGTLTYGLISVFQWVFLMCAHARHHHHHAGAHASISVSRRNDQ
jgi:hypothetical protein